MKKYKDVESYIKDFPSDTRILLKQIRAIIKKTAPDAEEGISYGMPGYKQNGPLVYFGGFKNHVSLFALPKVQGVFKKQLSAYKTSKGTIQFSLTKPLPLALIKKIVGYRVKENLKKESHYGRTSTLTQRDH